MSDRYILEATLAWASIDDMENNLTAILTNSATDYNNAYVWKYGDEIFFPLVAKKWDGISWTYLDNDVGSLNVRTELYVSGKIGHYDDDGDDTYIYFSEDRIRAIAGNIGMIDMDETGTQRAVRFNYQLSSVDTEIFGTQTLICRADADRNALVMQDNATLHFGTDRDGGAQYNIERNRVEIGSSTTTRIYGSDVLLDPDGYIVLGAGHTLRFDKDRAEVSGGESVTHYIEAVDASGNVVKLAVIS